MLKIEELWTDFGLVQGVDFEEQSAVCELRH